MSVESPPIPTFFDFEILKQFLFLSIVVSCVPWKNACASARSFDSVCSIGPCLQNHVADCGKLRQGPFEQKMFNAVLTETREEWKNWCKHLNQVRWTVNEHQINQLDEVWMNWLHGAIMLRKRA